MECLLRGLFDFQKFENNTALRNVIDSVHCRYNTRELSLENLDQIYAAGAPMLRDPNKNAEN